MKKHDGMNIFGIFTGVLLFLANSLHILWTYWLTVEQIETGWGYSTNLEMMALLPWMLELLSIPLIIAEVVYLVMSYFKRHHMAVFISNIALFGLLIMQYVLTNLFLFY